MPKTLLLADDSVTIQKVVGISFASEDIELVTVDNGDDAIAKAREVRPDIVLADVVMPGMTGYEVCDAIKTDPQLRHIPVLLLTGTFEAFDEQRASASGADGHITKPFEAQSLVDTVNARLASAPQAPAPPEPALAADSTLDPITAPPVEAPEALTTIEPALGVGVADEASVFGEEITEEPGSVDDASPFDFAAGADTQIPSEPTPAPVVDIHPAPSEDAEALTTAMLIGSDAEPEADYARTQIAFSPSPAAETHVAFGQPEDDEDELFAAATSGAAMPGSEDDLLAPMAPMPDPLAPEPLSGDGPSGAAGDDLSGAAGDDLSEAAGESAPDLFAETGASFAAASDSADLPGGFGDSGSLDPMADAFGGPMDGPTATSPREPAIESMPEAIAEPVSGARDEHDAAIEGALLDPDPGRDYDVSVSDLGAPMVPLADPDPMTAEPVMTRVDEPIAQAEPIFSGDPAFGDPNESSASDALFESPEVPMGESPEAAPMADSADAPRAFDDDALRNQLHESLERIAWDSFGDVTERIVSEAVERIEKVAWEVIPQMAEALIREEIRRMKGDD